MLNKYIIPVLVAIFICVSNVLAQKSQEAELHSRIQTLIESALRQDRIPGLAVGIIKNKRVTYTKAFGMAKIGGNKPITARSVFHMASVTKPFVATAIMQLVERGKINLDARVVEYLPYFRMKDQRYKDITVRQMLSHVAGLPDVEDYGWDRPEYDEGALERYVRGLSARPLVGAPGEKFAYSNIGFEVLGDVIAKASGMSFEDYVRRNIFTLLGMKHSTLMIRSVNAQQLATPHLCHKSGGVTVSSVFPYNRPHAPSSTLYSTVEDMNRWALANLNRGELDGKRILQASSYDLLWKPQVDVPEPPNSPYDVKVGLSWFLLERQGHRLVGHGGSDRGFQSFLVLAPDDGMAVVMMINCSSDAFNIDSLALKIMDLALGVFKSPFADKLDSAIPKLLQAHDVPGLAVGVIERGRISFTRGYGIADQEVRRPMSEDTVLNFASISKPVTAWGMMRLVETRKLSLDSPVGPLLYRWALPKSGFDNDGVTIRRLLSHTAGISVPSVPWFPADSAIPRLEQMLSGLAGDKGPVRVEKQPGAAWSYSGGGYAIIQLLIEELSKQPFDEYMRAQVFKPLGMNSTSYIPRADLAARTGVLYGADGRPVPRYRLVGEAAGGLNSTVRDFVRFLAAYVATDDQAPGRKIISPASLKLMTSPVAKVELPGVNGAMYGLGHGVHRAATGDLVVYHSGGNPGVRAYFLVSLTQGNGMIVITNSDKGAPVLQEVIRLWGEHYKADLQPLY
jgi:CubicO group peptidase (beta-lactamase class C family)